MSQGENGSGKEKQSVIDDLDLVISRFSDDASYQETKETINLKENSVIRMFSPPGLEEEFKQLHSILLPCLSPSSDQKISSTTASAILTGSRGCGKNLLLDSCLAACKYQYPTAKFRLVLINGIVCRGSNVSAVIYEIIKQLSDLAFQETKEVENNSARKADSNDGNDSVEREGSAKRRRLNEDNEKYLLRLRKSNFASNMALLESTLRIAAIDKMPILLVLDELECFTEEDERQVLLYHLLDRVATPGSSLCLVGITSNYTALSCFEKRIKSRVEGVSKLIYVPPPNTYEKFLVIVRQKFGDSNVGKPLIDLILKPLPDSNGTKGDIYQKLHNLVWSTMEREFRVGRDTRWFGRVLSTALGLYRLDVEIEDKLPEFQPQYLMDALVMLGSFISDDMASATKQPSLTTMEDNAVHPRLQAMLDISKPQVVLLLAARRILVREAHREQAVASPLTIQRMLNEYESSFRRGAQRKESLIPAARTLLERGIFTPSMDHSGGGPIQYHASLVYKTLDPYSLVRLPLHLPIDIDRELDTAISRNLLECSTALREWGRKVN
jgi:hypothetical protein